MKNIISILNEECHISNDVLKVGNNIFNDFIEEFKKTEWFFNRKLIELNYSNSPIFNKVYKFNFIIINYDDIDGTSHFEDSTFNGVSIIIKISIFNKQLDVSVIKRNILHELEHVYQKYMTQSKGSTFRMSDLYRIALEHINDNNEIIKTTSNLLYKLNQKESDSHLHEYYTIYMLYYKNGLIPNENNSFFMKNMIELYNLYEKYLSFERNSNFNSLIKQTFKRTDGQLKFYFKHGIKYLQTKLKQVEKKAIKDLNTPSIEEQKIIIQNNKPKSFFIE